MSPIKPEDIVHFSDPWQVAQSFILKQGFHLVLMDGMQRVVNEEQRKNCEFWSTGPWCYADQTTLSETSEYHTEQNPLNDS
jgi:hypothetical protein